MKIKLIFGFRKDQEYSLDISEAHKAYYLFLNPNARSIFSDGLAILGSDIDRIEPDYNGSMGWNAKHVLDEYDMREIRESGMDKKLREAMKLANQVAKSCTIQDLGKSLKILIEEKGEQLKLDQT